MSLLKACCEHADVARQQQFYADEIDAHFARARNIASRAELKLPFSSNSGTRIQSIRGPARVTTIPKNTQHRGERGQDGDRQGARSDAACRLTRRD
jgi:hypothetical protein